MASSNIYKEFWDAIMADYPAGRAPHRVGLCGWSVCADDRCGDSMFCAEHHLRALAAGCPQEFMHYHRNMFPRAMDWSNAYEESLGGRKCRKPQGGA